MINNWLKKFKEVQARHHPTALDFEYNIGYVLQAARNGFFFHESRDSAAIYTDREKGDPRFKVIVATVGARRADAICDLAKALTCQGTARIVAKNIDPDLETMLVARGWRNYSSEERWDEETRYDDNTFPQQVVETTSCSKLEGAQYGSLREELRRFDRQSPIRQKPYSDEREFWKILDKWSAQMAERTGKDPKELIASHAMFSERRDDFTQRIFVDSRDEAIGFASLSEVSLLCLGYNALLCDFEYRNLYRKMMHEGICLARELGYRYVNLQGSEDESQYLSKRRFKASIELAKKHLVFSG